MAEEALPPWARSEGVEYRCLLGDTESATPSEDRVRAGYRAFVAEASESYDMIPPAWTSQDQLWFGMAGNATDTVSASQYGGANGLRCTNHATGRRGTGRRSAATGLRPERGPIVPWTVQMERISNGFSILHVDMALNVTAAFSTSPSKSCPVNSR